MAKAQTLSSKTFSELSAELAECKQTMFDRYDIDRSGTLNSAKELRQLCTNLCIKLQLTIKVETIEEWCQEAGEMEKNCWKVDEFETWFKNTFIQRLGQPDAESEANAAAMEGASAEDKTRSWTLHDYELENDEEYCWVMIFPNEDHKKREGMDQEEKDAMKAAREDAMYKMLRAGLALKIYTSADKDEYVVEIGAPQTFLEFVGTQLKIPVKFSRMIKDPDDPTKEILKTGYEPFDMCRIQDFCGASGDWTKGKFFFRSKPRAQIVLAIMTDRWDPDANLFGAHVDSASLISAGHLKHCFASHGPLLSTFDEIWSRFGLIFQFCPCSSVPEGQTKCWPWEQPIDNIRDYFGERLAMYFSFLGFYTHALISPTLWGLAAGIVQNIFQDAAPLIAEWAVVAYCIQIVIWATVFLENWKRKQAENAHRWGMRGLTSKEIPMPAFEGKYDPLLETLVYDMSNDTSRSCKIATAAGIVFFCLLTVAGTMAGFTILQNILNYVNPNAGTLVGIVNAICIIVFNDLYKNLAAVLTSWENHRTETEYNNNLVLKCFLFQFINSYFSLYITAFIKPWTTEQRPEYTVSIGGVSKTFPKVEANTIWTLFGSCSCKEYLPEKCWENYGAKEGPFTFTGINGTWDQCVDSVCSNLPASICMCEKLNCKWDVAMLLITVFGIQIVWGNISEIIVPQIVFYFKNKADDGIPLPASEEVPDEVPGVRSPAEIEAVMPNYEEYVYAGIFDDYNELVLQFGFVTLFATNFPYVGCLAFLNNLIEIRSDAFKFVHVYRRPTPRPCEKIGTWYTVMEIMTFAAVTTNCANVFFVSDFSKDMAFSTRVFGMFAAEHCAYFLKFLIAAAIDDVSPEIAREIEYEDCLKDKALFADLTRRVNEEFAAILPMHRNLEVEPPKHFTFEPWVPPEGYVEKGKAAATTKTENPLSGDGTSVELKEVVTQGEVPSWVTVEEGGTFTMEEGVELTNGEGASCKIENGATLKLETGSLLHVGAGGVMIVESNANMRIEDQTEVKVGDSATFKVENAAKLTIENDAEFIVDKEAKFTLQSNSEAKFENACEVKLRAKAECLIENDAKFLLETNGEMEVKEGASAVFQNKSDVKVVENFILVVTEQLLVESEQVQVFNEETAQAE